MNFSDEAPPIAELIFSWICLTILFILMKLSALRKPGQDVYNATPQGAQPGDILRKDLNGDGRIDANDMKAYPQFQRDRPTTYFGLNGYVQWKGFDIAFLFQGSAGRKDFWINAFNNVNFGASRYASTWDHWNNPWTGKTAKANGHDLGGSGNNYSTCWYNFLAG